MNQMSNSYHSFTLFINIKYIHYNIEIFIVLIRTSIIRLKLGGSIRIFNMRVFNNGLMSYCFRVLISFWLLLGYCGFYSFGLKTYKPVVLVHGILTNYTTISDLAERIVKVSCSQRFYDWVCKLQFRPGQTTGSGQDPIIFLLFAG